MKITCVIGLLLFFTVPMYAQDITGIWRGYFYSGYGIYRQEFKYEVQINQLDAKRGPGSANPIKGVTYSYRQTSFYGKARFVGIYSSQTKELTLKEDTLMEVKMDGNSFSCLMTCYLEYHKMGEREVLEGSFSSITTAKGTDCGSGTVYLERVPESDFKKEDFLLKKKPKKQDLASTRPQRQKPNSSALEKKTAPPVKQTPKPGAVNKPAVKPPAPPVVTTPKKPGANNNTASSSPKKPVNPPKPPVVSKADTVVRSTPVTPPVVAAPPAEQPLKKQLPPVPDIIKQRDNPLVKTIVTNSPDISIDLYDNGEIDGDTITVYNNNSVVAYRKGLTAKPVNITLKASADDAHHELIMVANNLGSIPPNTALMVVKTGGKRYELFISSNEEKNAKVVIDYQPNSNPIP